MNKIKLKILEPGMLWRLLLWCGMASVIGVLSGIASTLFLGSVDWAINFRREHDWIILFLPLVGFIVAYTYKHFGKGAEKGNNLILDEIHNPQNNIPFRMVPMIFISAVISHLFGASIGREGAAVQMGAGISDQLSKYFGNFFNNRKLILKMGMSAGFASIFGTPIAGAIFGFEVLFIGTIIYDSLLPCMVAAIAGYYTALILGVHHAPYLTMDIAPVNLSGIVSALVAGIIFGYVAKFFVWSIKEVKELLKKFIKNPLFHPVVGGCIMTAIYFILGTDRYNSLGEEIIHASFVTKVYPWDFAAKIFTTVASVGSGFRGGEVMSLFYIGSTLGNTLSTFLTLDFPVLAALGFVGVFAGALNTPIASVILAFECFGPKIGVYAALACVTSYLFSGNEGIYHSQREHTQKKI